MQLSEMNRSLRVNQKNLSVVINYIKILVKNSYVILFHQH